MKLTCNPTFAVITDTELQAALKELEAWSLPAAAFQKRQEQPEAKLEGAAVVPSLEDRLREENRQLRKEITRLDQRVQSLFEELRRTRQRSKC